MSATWPASISVAGSGLSSSPATRSCTCIRPTTSSDAFNPCAGTSTKGAALPSTSSTRVCRCWLALTERGARCDASTTRSRVRFAWTSRSATTLWRRSRVASGTSRPSGSPTSSPCPLRSGAFSRKSFPSSSRPAVSDSWSGMATSQVARSRTRRRIRCASVKRPRGFARHHRRTSAAVDWLRQPLSFIVRPLNKRQCQFHGSITVTEIKLYTGLIVPERIITNFNAFAHQDVTSTWLSSLPTVIEALCAKWQIALEPVIGDTWITVVLFGTSPDLGPVVMKSSPNAVDVVAQARAFEIGAGDNVPRLYDLDLAHGTMVMERIVPGTELRQVEMDDDVATRIAAETLRTFWRPVSEVEGLIPQRRVLQPLFDWTPQPSLIDTSLVAQA